MPIIAYLKITILVFPTSYNQRYNYFHTSYPLTENELGHADLRNKFSRQRQNKIFGCIGTKHFCLCIWENNWWISIYQLTTLCLKVLQSSWVHFGRRSRLSAPVQVVCTAATCSRLARPPSLILGRKGYAWTGKWSANSHYRTMLPSRNAHNTGL